MNKERFKLFIPKSVVERKDIEPYEVAVYCALKALALQANPTGYDEMYASLDLISYTLFRQVDVSCAIRNELSSAFNELVRKEIVKISIKGKSYSVLPLSQFEVDIEKGHFIIVYLDEILKLTTSDEKIKIRLLKYFIHLVGTIDARLDVTCNGCTKRNVVGNQSQDTIAKITGVSPSSVIKYNRWLERLKLIHTYRSSEIILTENGFRQAINVYGRYEDKIFIDTFASDTNFTTVQERTDKLYASDNGRRLGAMYNWLCRGKKYSEVEIKEIYNYIMMYNEKLQKLYDKYNKEEYLEQLKDTTVFEQFEFLKK